MDICNIKKMKKIFIINGPNLNLLGKREVEIYGEKPFEEFFLELKMKYSNIELEQFQSNYEGELISKLQEIGYEADGVVLNAAGLTHTSVAIADVVSAIKTPVIEVHISNVFAREQFRKVSYLSPYCIGQISGFGLKGYEMALNFFLED